MPELDLVPPPNILLFSVTAERVMIGPGDMLQVSNNPIDGQLVPEDLRLYYASVSPETA